MPTYTYRCMQCTHQFDAIQSITEKKAPACPACGSLTESIIHGRRTIISTQAAKPSLPEKEPDMHACGPTCARHYIDDLLKET